MSTEENKTEAKHENDPDSQYEDIDEDEEKISANVKAQEPVGDEKIKKKDPSNIPRKGYFFEHDTREDEQNDTKESKKKYNRRQFNRKLRPDINDKWTHDRFDEIQQQPKSKNELVKRYGYDIRQEKDVESVKPIKKEEKVNGKIENFDEGSDEELQIKRDEIIRNSDDDDFGQRLANLRRRKVTENPKKKEFNQNYDDYKLNERKTNNKNFNQNLNNNNNNNHKHQINNNINNNKNNNYNNNNNNSNNHYIKSKYPKEKAFLSKNFNHKNIENLESQFKNMSIKNENLNNETPKRYSTIRNQNVSQQQTTTVNHSQNVQNHQVQAQQYQMIYQNSNWQPSFPQNYTHAPNSNSMQVAPPPGLPLPQNQNNRQYYYIPQNDYVAAQEYAAAMAASLMSNPIFYSNGVNGSQGVSIPSPSLSPLTTVHGYNNPHIQDHFSTRQSKAIPIVNPNRLNK